MTAKRSSTAELTWDFGHGRGEKALVDANTINKEKMNAKYEVIFRQERLSASSCKTLSQRPIFCQAFHAEVTRKTCDVIERAVGVHCPGFLQREMGNISMRFPQEILFKVYLF